MDIATDESWVKIRKDQKNQLLALILFTFALRIIFLHWNKGEYTDGILQLTLFSTAAKNTFFMPLYTLLTMVVNFLLRDMETSGKVVSMVSGVLGIIPIYLLGRRMFQHKVGLYAAILYSISPELWRWQIRVMTDSLFCTLFLWCVYHVYVLLERAKEEETHPEIIPPNYLFHLGCAWLAGGLATLTRYQGLGLLPLLFVATILFFRRKLVPLSNNQQIAFSSIIWMLAFFVWLEIPTWWFMRGMGHAGQYSERMAGTLSATIASYLVMAEGFVVFFPYVMTYPIFLFAVYGFFLSYLQGRRIQVFYWVFLYLFVLWLLAHAPFQSFQFRYFLPIISLALIPAGYGLHYFQTLVLPGFLTPRVRGWVCFLAISICLAFSVSSLFLQRDTFGDIKESALYMKEHLAGKRIFDNEQYRPGVNNIKVRYWSGLPVNLYDPNQLQPGDYVCLHNVQADLNRELTLLSQRFLLIPVYESRVQTIPLLEDIMVAPPFTSRPEALLYKYFPQNFVSVVYLLGHEKKPPQFIQ